MRSYRTLFIFAAVIYVKSRGSLVSVALSLRLLLVAVSNSPALCCPDFPLHILERLADNLAQRYYNTKLTLSLSALLLVERAVNGGICLLVELPRHMTKADFLEPGYHLLDCVMDWPQITIFYLKNALHLVNDQ